MSLPSPTGRFRHELSQSRLETRSRSSAIIAQASPIYRELQNEQGQLCRSSIPTLLESLQIGASDYHNVLVTIAGDSSDLTFDQTMALIGILQNPLSQSPSNQSLSSDSSSSTRAPLRKLLNKSRSYLETGYLDSDGAVLNYMGKLDEHRRKCEESGRYTEANAASRRVADLRTQQIERHRQGLISSQERELQEVDKVSTEEATKFAATWAEKISTYEANFSRAVQDLRTLHEQQQEQFMADVSQKKAFKLRPSKDYLNQKKMEEYLAKSQQYEKALQMHEAAQELLLADTDQAYQTYEAEKAMLLAKFVSKQQLEMGALLQRGARGRDELELKRISDSDRLRTRFRNVIKELESLHRLELAHLENFLDAQVQAGKAVPLKGAVAFRRKREVLFNTQF